MPLKPIGAAASACRSATQSTATRSDARRRQARAAELQRSAARQFSVL
jgi:hypothetical protein